MDSLIVKIAAAQEPDGYIYTTRTINPQSPHRWAGSERWVLERDDSHELYNLGHLFEAAVAHNLATGKKNLLDVATKAADLLVKTFGPGKRTTWPGHQITEMGLVRMYRVTGKEEYLSLAKFLLDERGPAPLPPGERANPRGLDYNQAQLKIVDQTEPVGHAVRAMYMYSGMADIAALTGDDAIRKAGDKIWDNLTTGKLYITGGIGSSATGEAFGKPYELPNMTAYNETCASVGMDYWNHRLFLLYGDAKYVDIMERTLYNGLMSGVSLDGKTFFYPNPLESNGQHERSPWFGVACCPSNITRFMASVPGYLYAKAGNALYVNLYAAGTADIDLNGRKVKVVQETRYPWDGAVKLTVTPDQAAAFAVKVRIPGWARNEPVPSNLYTFVDKSADAATVKVNGQPVSMTLDKGYVTIDRSWKPGDVIEMTLPMPVRRVAAHESVEADRGRVALQRGPIVFTAEWVDNPSGKVRNIVMPDSTALTSRFRADLLNGVQVIEGRAVGLSVRCIGQGAEAGTAVRGHPLCDVGQPRPRTNGRLACAHRVCGAADAVPDDRDGQHDHHIAVTQDRPQHHRRRGTSQLRRFLRVFRLVATPWLQGGRAARRTGRRGTTAAVQSERVGRDGLRQAGERLEHRGLLVRRHGPRRRPRTAIVEAALQGRRHLEAGRRRHVRRRAGRLEYGHLQTCHDVSPSHRVDDAAGDVRGVAGMEG